MKEFERQICSLSGQKKLWENVKPFYEFFCHTTSFQKSDIYMQCEQESLKQGQSLQKEHSNSRDLRYFAAVILQADLKQDTRRRL